MDVVVEVGDWEHECCGEAVERNPLVDFQCIRCTRPDGHVRLFETHHGPDVPADVRVQGRVVGIEVVDAAGTAQPILRVPSGAALRDFANGDGHPESPWTGNVITSTSRDFFVTVRTSGRR